MQANEKTLIEFLRDKQQFTIPIYQRTYSWTKKQCLKLWEDIEKIASKNEIEYHFMGSIVRIKRTLDTSEISQQIVIDGQQRITTILLLIAALIKILEDENRREELQEAYLINRHGKAELKYKMLLTRQDKSSLINIIENRLIAELESERIKENYKFFEEKIVGLNAEKIYSGIRKLMIVDISLDPAHDNPQLIFESLNSTGLALSQADLIRNYILMGLKPEQQEKLYNNYWRAMEENFGQTDYKQFFDRFMRDYLTIKTGTIPNINNVYETFKEYFSKEGGTENVENFIADITKYSKYFVRMVLEKEKDIKLKEAFSNLKDLNFVVATPFLLNIYNDFEEKIISKEIFLNILNLIQSYVFRRFVCGIPTGSLNKTFSTLYKLIDKQDYLISLKVAFINMRYNKRFPKDIEFVNALKEKDLYNIRNRNFWLNKLENFNRKERVTIEDYTIEHVMPQTLTDAWEKELGENWNEVHEKYLNTIGNLTLTGYNPELSNKPFFQKQNMEGGFKNSPLKLNESLQQIPVWNERAIKERAEGLAKTMLKIWPYLKVSEEDREKYTHETKGQKKQTYTIEDHPFLTGGPMKELFETVRKRIMNIDACVKEEFLKLYVAYKADTNFVDIVPQKSKLRCYLNINYEEIYDPKSLCKDVTNLGKWGNGDTEINISSPHELQYALSFIKQAFEKNSES